MLDKLVVYRIACSRGLGIWFRLYVFLHSAFGAECFFRTLGIWHCLYVFPRMTFGAGCLFSRASHLALAVCFPALRIWRWMYVFPRFAFGAGCTFSRALSWLHVFPLWFVSRVVHVCCDWQDLIIKESIHSVQWCAVFYFSSFSSSDLDECSSNSTNSCQYACINTLGSYKCDCPVGYYLSADGKKCQGWLLAIYTQTVKMGSFAFLTNPVVKKLFLLQELRLDGVPWKHNANFSNFCVVNPQGSHGSWKSWKVLEFYCGIF